jgi:hypothetical protein
LDDQKEKAENLIEKAKEIDDDLIERIKDLKGLISGSRDKRGL